MKYGIYLNGYLQKKYETPIEAYEAAIEVHKITNEFVEVKGAHPFQKTVDEMENEL